MVLHLFFFILSMLSNSIFAFECGGVDDHITLGPSSIITRSSSYSPIRITFDCFDCSDFDFRSYLISTLLPRVSDFFTKAIQIKSVQGLLNMTGIISCGPEIQVREYQQIYGEYNTDVLIYIVLKDIPGQNYIAYSGACAVESSGLQNVYAGRIVINPTNFASITDENRFSVLVHEIIHVLGFSKNLYKYWKNSSGANYTEVTKTVEIRGVNKIYIVTPQVKTVAQSVYNCGSLEGMELEDQGNEDTISSHWDMRVLINDVMITEVVNDKIFSNLTLALLADTGWYTVNYTMGQLPLFGTNGGCSFFTEKCLQNDKTQFSEYFCDTDSTALCDFNHLYKSYCSIAKYPISLPTNYQYYTDTYKGGSDIYTDYCPYSKQFINGNCRGNASTTFVNSLANETISLNSRCFQSTLVLSGNTIPTAASSCYEVIECNNDNAVVKIGDKTVNCPLSLTVPENVIVTGYDGSLTCPAFGILCKNIPCKNSCFGRGACVNSKCVCSAGYTGDDCSEICGKHCASCNNGVCLICLKAHMDIKDDHCICSNNYVLDSTGSCVSVNKACELLCGNCTIASDNSIPAVCNSCTENAYKDLSSGQCTCNDGYYDLNTYYCTKCPNLCTKCTSEGCDGCIANAHLNSSLCECDNYYYQNFSECLKCPDNCYECSSDLNCLYCDPGYYPEEDLGCFLCNDTCKTCNNYDECTSCKSGNYLNNRDCLSGCPDNTYKLDGSCKSCPMAFCKTCDIKGQCFECIEGYYMDDDICHYDCPDNCKKCTSSGICEECEDKHFLLYGMCYECSSGCLSCKSIINCEECAEGFELINGFCSIQCMDGCKKCSETSVCEVCKLAYFLDGNGVCKACPNSCSSCLSSTLCTSCTSGHLLQAGICMITCPNNCKACSSGICHTCDSGFTLKNGICTINCPLNCNTCDTNGKCSQCNNGFYINTGNCYSCSNNCGSCKNANKCLICNSEYYLSDDYCYKCSIHCVSCSNDLLCNECDAEHTLKNGICVKV
ncbi:hypothetical protein SteCoe_37346 [Stentor coeruleus]|uniref:EGF-like domain-containing protein n=1 Tax=Stentor coeruleus TaxID=5963 RepID=A0A1R2AN73_9CILI|nr:hypothetical protein SteCoe_37346 [Stentor coeruleus]